MLFFREHIKYKNQKFYQRKRFFAFSFDTSPEKAYNPNW